MTNRADEHDELLIERTRVDSIAAAARLAQSPRVRTWVTSIATFVLLPGFTALASWYVAKQDTKADIAAMSGHVKALSGDVAGLVSQQADLVERIDGLTAAPNPGAQRPGGPIYQLRNDMRFAHRNAVRATAFALSPARDRKGKLAAAAPLLEAFDNRYAEGLGPTYAADVAIGDVAIAIP